MAVLLLLLVGMHQGWPREQAEAATLISSAVNTSLAASVRNRSDRYAASAHLRTRSSRR